MKLVDELETRTKAGVQKPCFMTELLASNDEEKFTPEEIAFIAGTLIEAVTDTTRTSMLGLIAGTAMYPDWVERARKELDAVCGSNAERLPTFDDMQKLPMIKAALKESVRWRYACIERSLVYKYLIFPFQTNECANWNSTCSDKRR
jgi:cytochrome P450